MKSIDRIAAAIDFEKTDRVPVIPEIFGHAAHIAGVQLDKYIRNGKLIAECQIQALDHYGGDAVFAIMDLNVETEAMGSVLTYSHDSYSTIETYALSERTDIAKLSVPDPIRSGRMPELLKAINLLRTEVGNETLVAGCALGPLTLAAQLMSLEKTLYLAIDRPEIFNQLLDFTTELCIDYGVAQLDAGAHVVILVDISASSEIVPHQFFREFELPKIKNIFARFKDAGAVANWLFITGKIDPILQYYPEAGVDIAAFDYCVEPETIKKALPQTCVNGNIKPLSFEYSHPEEIAAASTNILNQFSDRSGFILSSGCEIPPKSRPETIHAMVETARKSKT
ncbi:MAG: uroporphyrinogen decarboxylase [Gammaproteobacteria bacterium]|nr:uroporphyrinogen decarboxylase [Gammaproteobacteria bacterium]